MRKQIAVGALVLLVGSGGAAWATSTADQPDPALVEAARADLDALYDTVWGDPADVRAANIIPYLDYNESITACMAAKGFDFSTGWYDGAHLDDHETSYGLYLGFGSMGNPAAEGWEPAIGRSVATAAARARHYAGPAAFTAAPAASAALAKCQAAAPPVDADRQYPSAHAELSQRLGELTDTDRAIAHEVWDGYTECAADRGFDIMEPPDLYGQVTSRYSGFRVRDDPTETPLTEGPEWDAAVAFERQAAAVDFACRREREGKALLDLAPRVQQFRIDNAEALAAAEREWTQIRAEADARMSESPLASTWSLGL